MKKSRQNPRHRKNQRIGSTAVEMAIVLPIFLSVVFACIEFSRLSMVRSQASNAAYEGARYAMVQGSTIGDANEAVEDHLMHLGIRGAVTTVRFENEGGAQVIPGLATRINVQVDVPYRENGLVLSLLPESLSDVTVTSQITLRTNVHAEL